MHHHLVEIKARCQHHDEIRTFLQNQQAEFKGVDYQKDTYFNVKHGRLKWREGNIENHLIQYFREEQHHPKNSDVLLHPIQEDSSLKEMLTRALGILCVVEKEREIYFIGNVKFHLDQVTDLGSFVEIEAIGEAGKGPNLDKLTAQCNHYLKLFNLKKADMVAGSYSDLIIDKS